jgi:ATP-dependent RNA helicase RhlE
MGRQTLWGGLGKPPSREVMQAAARAARQEMMQRIRDNKATQGQPGRAARPPRAGDDAEGGASPRGADGQPGADPARKRKRRRGKGSGAGPNAARAPDSMPARACAPKAPWAGPMRRACTTAASTTPMTTATRTPCHATSIRCRPTCTAAATRGPSHGAAGQPDPMRTSIDLMGGKGGGKRNRGGGGGFGGGKRSGGGFGR